MTAKNNIIVLVVAAVLALGAYWFLLLTPKQEEASKLADQIKAKQAELDTAKREVATYQVAKASYKTNYATVTRLGKAVPADDDIRSLMVQLDSAAARAGIDIRTVDASRGTGTAGAGTAGAATLPPGATLNPAGFAELPVSFAFTGSYFELAGFLRRVERFVTVSNERIDVTGRLLTLQTLALKPDTEGFPKIRAEIGATSYLVPATEGLTSGATPQAPGGTGTGTEPAADPATAPATTATLTGAVR